MVEIKIHKNLEQLILSALNELTINEGITVTQRVARIIDLVQGQKLLEFTDEDLHYIYKGVGYALAKSGIRGTNHLMVFRISDLIQSARVKAMEENQEKEANEEASD